MILTGKVELGMTFNGAKATALADDDNAKVKFIVQLLDDLTNGASGADNVDVMYTADGSMIASATDDYDLDTSLTDAFGVAADYARVKCLVVQHKGGTGVLQVGGGTGGIGTNAWDTWCTSTAADGSEGIFVRPGGIAILYAPGATAYAVTAATGDILHLIEVAAAAMTYKLYVVGTSA